MLKVVADLHLRQGVAQHGQQLCIRAVGDDVQRRHFQGNTHGFGQRMHHHPAQRDIKFGVGVMGVTRLWRRHRCRELHSADRGEERGVVTHHIRLRRFASHLLIVAIQGRKTVPERFVIVAHARRSQVGQRITDHGELKIVEAMHLAVLEQKLPRIVLNERRPGTVLWHIAP
ncbi:hypothetical protein D3C73_503590 [compost metagenome]